jgi:ferredoxin
MRVRVDRALCDSHGVCAVEAPEVFELTDADELIVLKEEPGPGDLDAVTSAVRLCPKRALTLADG